MYVMEKCLLACFNAMQDVIEKMDGLFLKTALGSYHSTEPCEAICDKLIEMTERKADLLFLVDTIEKALGNLPSERRKFLEYKFFGVKDDEIESIKGSRKYYRRQLAAIVGFSVELKKVGFTEDDFKDMALKFSFIASVYKDFSNKNAIAQSLPSSCYKVSNGKILSSTAIRPRSIRSL